MFKTTWATPLTEISTAAKEVLGSIRVEAQGKRIYKYVQYKVGAGPVAAVLGQVCYYYAPGGDFAAEGYTDSKVTSDLSDSAEVGAGVLQSAPAADQYCWIQIKGAATLSIALTAGTDGDPLCPTGSTDGTLDVAAAVTDGVCAYAQDISDKTIICDFPF